jgi:hypothetical protein
MQEQLKPCPFCGRKKDIEDYDTLYPSGMYWIEKDLVRSYVTFNKRSENHSPCWQVSCACGASLNADSREEAIENWNKRNEI